MPQRAPFFPALDEWQTLREADQDALLMPAHRSKVSDSQLAAPMARPSAFQVMTFSELSELRANKDRRITEKRAATKAELRKKIADLAKILGLSLDEAFGRKRGNGSVAPKYRDPQNPSNTWTGRGRMPGWMTAALKGTKGKKEDFLI